MTTRTDENGGDEPLGVDNGPGQRYVKIRLEGGDLIIHDAEEESAWIQSGTAVERTSMR